MFCDGNQYKEFDESDRTYPIFLSKYTWVLMEIPEMD